MIQAKCIQKFRDKNGKIYGYRLIDINETIQDVTSENLKRAIDKKEINVVNLTLTADGRLVDCKPKKQLVNKKILGDAPRQPEIKLNKHKRPAEADNYREFTALLIQLLEKSLKVQDAYRFLTSEEELDSNGELIWKHGRLDSFVYNNRRCHLELSLSTDKDYGYFNLDFMEDGGNIKPLYSESYSLYAENMEANFSHILKLCHKVVVKVLKLKQDAANKPKEDTQDDMVKLVDYCANYVTQNLKGISAVEIDMDSGSEGTIQATYELGIVYKGSERQLDIGLYREDEKYRLFLGLVNLDVDDFCTEFDKCLEFSGNINANTDAISNFLDSYVNGVKTLRGTKYRLLLTNLDSVYNFGTDEYSEYNSKSTLIHLMNEESFDDLQYDGALDDEILPYCFIEDSSRVEVIHDWQEQFLVAFVNSDDKVVDLLVYSMNKARYNEKFSDKFKLNTSRNKHADFCEDRLNLPQSEYIGFKRILKPIQTLKDLCKNTREIVLIEVGIE